MTTSIVPVPDLIDPGAFPTPSPNNAQYNRDAREWANKQKPHADSVVAIGQSVHANALATQAIAEDAKTVTGQNKTAAQQAQEAAELAAANAAGSAAFYGRWSELTGALTMPANVAHDGKDWRLVRNLADVTAAEPGVSDAWEMIVVSTALKRQQRSSNVQLSKEDSGQLIDITSSTFTQTFAAAATLGDGWWCYLQNSGTGDITLDPNASETIDGLNSYIMYPGEVRLVQCDGAELRSVVLNSFYKVFTASGTFIKPPGYSAFQGLLWGGGGGGGVGGSGYRGGGGGGGACHAFTLPSGLFSVSESITIASGGTGGSAGGTSSIGTELVSAFGGGAGGISNAANTGGGGGGGIHGSGGNGSNNSGSNGNGGDPTVTVNGAGIHNGFGGGNNSGGTTVYGGGGGASGTPGQNGQSAIYGGGGGAAFGATTGGASKYGGAGGASNTAGNAPGGGGGGGSTALGQAGARGELRIWGSI